MLTLYVLASPLAILPLTALAVGPRRDLQVFFPALTPGPVLAHLGAFRPLA